MTLLALIFDVDGTLAETECDGHRPAFNAAFAAEGLGWDWDPVLYGDLLAVTGGRERIRHYARQYDPTCAARPDFDALVARLHQDKTQRYNQVVEAGGLSLRPGVADLLRQARASGLRLAIATTTTPENVTTLLRVQLGPAAASWFDVIAAGDVVAAKKPAADIYLYCLARLGLAASSCLAIEDSGVGLAAARAAGLTTLVTPSRYNSTEDFTDAAAVVRDLAEVSLAQLRDLVSRQPCAVL